MKHMAFVGVKLGLVMEWDVVRDLEPIFSPKFVGRMTGNEIFSVAPEPEGLT